MSTLTSQAAAILGIAAVAAALFLSLYLLISPGQARLPLARRRPGVEEGPGALTSLTGSATSLIDRLLHRHASKDGMFSEVTLERAGLKMRPQDFALLLIVGMLTGFALGLVMSGLLLGLCFAVFAPIGAKVALRFLASRRQHAFADQLDDTLQLLATSLRAGHSLMQALDSVSREAEEPTASEFARVINETRVGRELGHALDETAQRMTSDDFTWVTQAIAINREVGGNLAEVLDGVGHTIRERNQIRRQVKALAAEGKLSAIVLMLLPFGIGGFLMISNPEYIGKLTHGLFGISMLVAGAVMLAVGGIWLRKVVSFKF
jgi:tight adherence protein B